MYALAIVRYRIPIEEVGESDREAHRDYLRALKKQGLLIASGPFKPHFGGAFLWRVPDANAAEILVAGNGNNNVNAAGNGDFIEVLGNGNNHLTDVGTNDLIWLGGDGNNDVNNQGDGSFTDVLAGTGHNHIRGHWGFAP